MRRLPTTKTPKQKLIIRAVDDYFGEGCSVIDRKLKKNICLWLMNYRRGFMLDEEQKNALWFIKNNLAA